MFDLFDDEEEINLQNNDNNNIIINDTGTDTNNNTILNFLDNSKENLKNSNDDFNDIQNNSGIPKDLIKDYLQKNKLYMMTYPEIIKKNKIIKSAKKEKISKICPIIKVKAALLQKSGGIKTKEFKFTYNEANDYYFLITKELNPNYMKPIIEAHKPRKMGSRSQSKDFDEKEENKSINLHFDYNKYNLKGILLHERNGKMEVFHQEIFNRELCQVSHTTKESIAYYQSSKTIKNKNENENFKQFARLCPEKYFLIEIEQKKPASETIIKEDGILSVLYLITPEKKSAINLFTMVKYCLYFCEETLCNHIGKFIRDMIYDFCHLPSECFEDFLSHIGCINKNDDEYNLSFPLKKYIKEVDILSKKCLVSHVYRNLPNISRPKAADKVPFHKFIFLYEKYKLYYEEKEFKIKQKYFEETKYRKYKNRIGFLEECFIKDPVNDKITKEHKLDLNKLLKMYFQILEKFLKENFQFSESNVENMEKIKDFLLQSLAKFLSQYVAFKGFLNIDIVINEDNRFEFQCCHNKACNRAFNDKIFCCMVGGLRFFNCLFHFNEGFFHQHFSIMDYSYNFNEKNVIHTFLSINDSSKKNKLRIFDIPFLDRWCYQIASLLLIIYRESFGFLGNPMNKFEEEKNIENDNQTNFSHLFAEIHNNITKDLFDYYKPVIPNYFEFCYKMSESPLDKYNWLDNLCQNFAIKSMHYLLKNNVIFFTPFEVVFRNEINKNKSDIVNSPVLNSIYEPYLILVDDKLIQYLKQKEKKREYLIKKGMDIKVYFNNLKQINKEKPHYTVFLSEKKEKEISTEKEDDDEEDQKENEINNIQTNEEEKQQEKGLEKTDTFSSSNSEIINDDKPIDIKKVYPKRMHQLNLKKREIEDFTRLTYNYEFYYLLNLYYNFTYDTMKDLKQNFMNYDTLKRYIASIESSITISFNDYDKTIMKQLKSSKNDKGQDCDSAKKLKKGLKKDIINNLKIMSKLTRMTRHMNCIFIDYMKKVISDIIGGNSEIRKRIGDEKSINKGNDYFLKIGHFMVNFKAYRAGEDGFEKFKESKIYNMVQNEVEIKDKMIIDK